MNIYVAAKLLALKATIEHDPDHERRRIMCWYSTTYHTPLHQVWELPIDFVLQAYYEDVFRNMEKDDIRNNIILLTETEEQKKNRIKEEEDYVDEEQAADDEFLKMVAEEEAAKAKQKPTGVTPEMPQIEAPKKISWSPKEESETELPSALHTLPTAQELSSMNEDEDSIKGLTNDWSLLTPSKKQT